MINVYLAIYVNLKIDWKLQEATETICVFDCTVSWLIKKYIGQLSNDIDLNKKILLNSKQHVK